MIYRYTRIAHAGVFLPQWRSWPLRGRPLDAVLKAWEFEGGALAPEAALGRKDHAGVFRAGGGRVI